MDKIYISQGYTDLRLGSDGYAKIVQDEFDLNPFENAIFLFCNKQRDKVKILYWDTSGFWLLYKRLEKGHFQWKKAKEPGVITITEQQMKWLMEGLKIEQKTAFKPLSCSAV